MLVATATAVGRLLNGWALLLAAVAYVAFFARDDGDARRGFHSHSLRNAAIAVAVSLLVVAPLWYPWDPLLVLGLRPSIQPGSPSIEGVSLVAAAFMLVASYGRRAAWLAIVPIAGAAAQFYSGDHVLEDIGQAWLFGSGFGLLVHASTRPPRSTEDPTARPPD